MSWKKAHIDHMIGATKKWLDPENPHLQEAISKTASEGLFSLQDVYHQLSVLRGNVENGDIQEWVKRAELSNEQNAKVRKVLCLHAGNLPLVGFQTALGVILSGADYYGKVSRKDPYLLSSFLEEIQRSDPEQKISYSRDLNSFEDLKADKVVFAGSEESVSDVKAEIKRLKAAKQGAEYIIRTAKFSIAYLDEWNADVRQDLTEAMLRYGGKGCRSVAVVVAPFGLDEVREELKQAINSYWKQNPQYQKPTSDLKYQYAYNEGIQQNQLWLNDFLIQESEELPDTDFTVNWVNGGKDTVRDLRISFGQMVQSVYTCEEVIEGIDTEPLSSAQSPPLYWKPDGVDVIKAVVG
ncbi:acyl-CoA reductase [Gracilimonas amylolytica]|uniref:acyl-CoA reductase n=1 Tax=Gracilimonas amylolytica TaxID=1749045 RepID=UPI001E5A0E1C|nr:acyl-CoA reductase [Gracilimonas amylolytica]